MTCIAYLQEAHREQYQDFKAQVARRAFYCAICHNQRRRSRMVSAYIRTEQHGPKQKIGWYCPGCGGFSHITQVFQQWRLGQLKRWGTSFLGPSLQAAGEEILSQTSEPA